MSKIRLLITAAAAFYAVIFLAQVALNASVAGQALAGVVLLAVATALTWMRDELTLKRYEMGLLWVMVLGFLVYAVTCALGVLP
ncbi:MAG TPA: hypothetical protein PKK74_05000 [Candidatus Methanoculleus thermohydrogenotrophicum]|jgi:hypothetical protein|nr:hypothetical protein [Candidatus Methanoculleus thermohydrogenotrophicum]NLM82774.1 hypothetical protein [Candidatus Methanoculleus thermohydrogenotrophicum]HOB18035.1 hypothetical protein [Candidatus Methanoculleus thermohydrogenotrophicum]HPZ38139.1 hypothetical protein [Candidatus Methanoculleus thermohydrogenotrophicum]HQC91011.1 hypothetical protein [Candidatus Methanoculleus thermohydrogenotrophicum]